MAKSKGGRPTALTDAVRERVRGAVAAGATREDAARAGGIGKTTLYGWMKHGRRSRTGKYREFVNEISRAEAEYFVSLAHSVTRAALGYEETTVKVIAFPDGSTRTEETTRHVFDWQAALQILARRRPEE
jgi:hypothetical protein